MKRTDTHKPSSIVPSDYEFVAFSSPKIETLGDAHFAKAERDRVQAHMARTGGTYSAHVHGGNCHICGATALYTCIFYHTKSNSYIRTGQDCATKLEMSSDEAAMNFFRKQIKEALAAQAGKRKAEALLAEKNLSACWNIYLGEGATKLFVGGYEHYEENTIRDIVGKLVKYGSASDKQFNFLSNLLAKIAQRPAIAAKRAAEHEAAADVTPGRISVSGEIVSLKEVATDFGMVQKMLVKADAGFKLYGTCNFDCKRGDRVQFTATVEASKDDSKFGFF